MDPFFEDRIRNWSCIAKSSSVYQPYRNSFFLSCNYPLFSSHKIPLPLTCSQNTIWISAWICASKVAVFHPQNTYCLSFQFFILRLIHLAILLLLLNNNKNNSNNKKKMKEKEENKRKGRNNRLFILPIENNITNLSNEEAIKSVQSNI